MSAVRATTHRTRQGNRAGRSAVIEPKCASLAGEFGMNMLRAKFPQDADAILAKLGVFSRGPRKGQQRGYVHWEKVVEGGFDYRWDQRGVMRPGTYNWCVRADGSINSEDVSAIVGRARVLAEEAEANARWDAMTPAEQVLDKARRIRAMAMDDLRDGELEDFHWRMGRARKHVREAAALARIGSKP